MRILSVTLVLLLALCGPARAQDDSLKGCEEHVRTGVPAFVGITPDTTELCRLGYAVAHDNHLLIPDWAAWHLTGPKATGCLPRKDSFKADPDLPKGKRAELKDYRGSGYDRGHMAPNADFLWSREAQKQSFYLSNMAPQLHQFNAGIWADLEELTRVWATEKGEVYVIDGPIFDDRAHPRTIGPDNVANPDYFFKVIYDPKSGGALSFIFPNAQIPGNDISAYQVTVHQVEQRSGLDLFKAFTQAKQHALESEKPAIWDADATAWRAARREKCRTETP